MADALRPAASRSRSCRCGPRAIGSPRRGWPSSAARGCSCARSRRRCCAGEIDLAVHSLKDLPAEPPAGAHAGARFRRARTRATCSWPAAPATLGHAAAPARAWAPRARGARALLLALRPDLDVEPIRGNVDTRLRKLDAGDFDAIVLAAAGLRPAGPEPAARASRSIRTSSCPRSGRGSSRSRRAPTIAATLGSAGPRSTTRPRVRARWPSAPTSRAWAPPATRRWPLTRGWSGGRRAHDGDRGQRGRPPGAARQRDGAPAAEAPSWAASWPTTLLDAGGRRHHRRSSRAVERPRRTS